MEENSGKNYSIQCTVPTLVLAVALYTLLTVAVGVIVGVVVNRQAYYINHFYAEDYANSPVMENINPLLKKKNKGK